MFVQYMNVSFKGVMTASSDANEQLSTNVVNLNTFHIKYLKKARRLSVDHDHNVMAASM